MEAPAAPHSALHSRAQKKKRSYKRSPKRRAKELAAEQRRTKVTELRLSGLSIRDIATKVGVSVGCVHSDLEEVLTRTITQANKNVDRERAISVARIERAIRGLWPKIKKGDEAAVNAFTKLDARRAKLLGLDVPLKAELTGADGAPLAPPPPTSQLESKLNDLCKRLGGDTSAAAAAAAPAAVAGDAPAGDQSSGSAGAQEPG